MPKFTPGGKVPEHGKKILIDPALAEAARAERELYVQPPYEMVPNAAEFQFVATKDKATFTCVSGQGRVTITARNILPSEIIKVQALRTKLVHWNSLETFRFVANEFLKLGYMVVES